MAKSINKRNNCITALVFNSNLMFAPVFFNFADLFLFFQSEATVCPSFSTL